MNTMKQMNKLMQSNEKDLKYAPTSCSVITCNKTEQDFTERQRSCSDNTLVLGKKGICPRVPALFSNL